MQSRKEFLGAFYSLPMSLYDRTKALAAGIRHVMVTFEHGRGDLDWLVRNNFEVTMRLDERDYMDPDHTRIVQRFFASQITAAQKAAITMIICGCEPENGLDMTWGSKTGWGNEVMDPQLRETRLMDHQHHHTSMRASLQQSGMVVCSPGWTMRDQDMRFGPAPSHGPQPGVQRWASQLLHEYGLCQYNGEHLYLWDGSDFDINQRGQRHVNQMVARRQRELIFDEINVGNQSYTKEECMRASLDIAEMLRHAPRVKRAFLFVLNGTPGDAWPANMLMDSAVCYDMLARWYNETGVDQ